MPLTHVVRHGECLSSIAAAYGFADYRTIYQDSSNADFRTLRRNPNIIFPGDVIQIPDKEKKSVPCVTGKSHKFVLKTRKDRLRIAVRDRQGRPLADKPYELTIDGVKTKGRTDGSGVLSAPIPSHASGGTLRVWMSDEDVADPSLGRDLALSIGGLDPAQETSGVQARLNNLGYDCGAVDGIHGKATAAALRAFQAANELSPTGEVDDATRAKLEDMHDDL